MIQKERPTRRETFTRRVGFVISIKNLFGTLQYTYTDAYKNNKIKMSRHGGYDGRLEIQMIKGYNEKVKSNLEIKKLLHDSAIAYSSVCEKSVFLSIAKIQKMQNIITMKHTTKKAESEFINSAFCLLNTPQN